MKDKWESTLRFERFWQETCGLWNSIQIFLLLFLAQGADFWMFGVPISLNSDNDPFYPLNQLHAISLLDLYDRVLNSWDSRYYEFIIPSTFCLFLWNFLSPLCLCIFIWILRYTKTWWELQIHISIPHWHSAKIVEYLISTLKLQVYLLG